MRNFAQKHATYIGNLDRVEYMSATIHNVRKGDVYTLLGILFS